MWFKKEHYKDIKWVDDPIYGEFPEHFSENARRIVSQQYFRNGEKSFMSVVKRVVLAITLHGEKAGYFNSESDADRFAERLTRGLLEQRFSFNSPVWYNLGVNDVPQCSACFIQPVDDNMESIMDLARNEAMLFKHGSGTGTNLSSLRSSRETLSKSDGYASGPVSFMRMYDAVAGAIKSGGRTRRAAKMQLLDVNHPDIMEFIAAKAAEGTKAKVLIASGMPPGEAYASVSLQNMNTSVRLPDAFMSNLDGTTQLKAKSPLTRLGYVSNQAVFDALAQAAWECGDPGVQFSDTIEADNMVPEFPIMASNPCSEFVFMDNSACNLASLNLLKYEELEYAEFALDVRVLVYAMDIIVGLSSYPTTAIRDNSHAYRPLGLGFSNLGAVVMRRGLLYDSSEARAIASNYAKDLMREACRASSELARKFGAFPGYGEAQQSILRRQCGGELPYGVIEHGVRNAQLTLIAPTGTISFMMDCESTGIEPVFAESTVKTLAGGGTVTLEPECVKVYKQVCLSKEDFAGTPDTAIGRDPVSPEGHLLMMAAVQPYLSGAISKTVNLPASATPQDIADVYYEAWAMGLKCVAVFRDGCKGWQPMEAKPQHIVEYAGNIIQMEALEDIAPGALVAVERVDDIKLIQTDTRRRMPDTRDSVTHKFIVGGVEGYLHIGEYADGTPGEVFVHVNKEGSTVGGLMDAWAICFSLALQYGVPLRKLVDKFKNTSFSPSGFTSGTEVKSATSLVDYIVRWMEIRYLAQSTSMGESAGGAEQYLSVEGKQPNGNGVIQRATKHYGEACTECGHLLVQTGTCKTCPQCGAGGGCG
jgi:ribonucleoside-diphosphate reductase alpha chain